MSRALVWMLPMLGACGITGSAGLLGSSKGTNASAERQRASSSQQTPQPAASPTQLTRAGNCDPDVERRAREHGYLKGTCWDPPGTQDWAEAVTMVPGRRRARADAYWFDIPKEAIEEGGRPHLPGYGRIRSLLYTPYDEVGGLPPFPVPDLRGKTLAESLDIFDALDRPAVIHVNLDGSCDKPHDVVCRMDPDPNTAIGNDGLVILTVSTDVFDAGTPKEVLRLRDLTDKPTEEVRATLQKVGFTSIEIVETDLPCERGLVCDIDPPTKRFYPRDEKIQLKVRRAKR